jgi:hypothetical protein
MSAVSPVLLGVRHHGPGSARAVRRALAAYRPEVVLIEGPPEAEPLVALAGSAQMRPPVALLAYTAGLRPSDHLTHRRSAYWPFAEFSPEWQAIRWAVANGVPVRFFDLPVAYQFGRPDPTEVSDMDSPLTTKPRMDAEPDPEAVEELAEDLAGDLAERERFDPIGLLAEAAGYDDPERWWEDVVEHRGSDVDDDDADDDDVAAALAPFAAIGAAMAEVRATGPAAPYGHAVEEQQREAHMRTALRAAVRHHERVAVVCGAWHVPALTAPLPPAGADATVLRGLPKARVAMTWVPWTHGRLASWRGYGAGVRSPGWYHHLFTSPDRPITRWLVAVARLLRDEGQPVSSAHVIEAVRLAETLAVLRGRPLAGLTEVSEATLSVLCDGDDLRQRLVDRRMVVGEQLGRVPDETPSVPLVADVSAAQKRLRLPLSALDSELDLDLRREIDLNRSRLLHRLQLLGVPWGTGAGAAGRRGKGTFWESWRLCWRPEFAVDLIEASGYGTTVAGAAGAKATELATTAPSLSAVTELLQQCLLADLPDAAPAVLRALEDRMALDVDVVHLMAALPALARTLRYGDVRGTDVSAVRATTAGLVVRICVGLPAAVTALDDAAATALRDHLDAVHSAIGLLGDVGLTHEWQQTLERLGGRDDLHGLIAGRLSRLLFDAGQLSADQAGRRLALVLTVGVAPARAAAWIEGFLAGGGLLLVHDAQLLSLVDGWLAAIPADTFIEVLPLLRRTFAEFAVPERRAIGERARALSGRSATAGGTGSDDDLDHARAALVLPTLRLLLGRDVIDVEAA